MDDESRSCCKYNPNTRRRGLLYLGLIAMISVFWIALRSLRKPSRFNYPCQQTALFNIQIFSATVLAMIPSAASIRAAVGSAKPALVMGILVLGSSFIVSDGFTTNPFIISEVRQSLAPVPLTLEEHPAASPDASDVFLIQDAVGEGGDMNSTVRELLQMMEAEGIKFYKTSGTPNGLVGNNDVIVLKVNAQWSERGGTSTDLVKSVIYAILNHPDGFTGEVVIADNGQGLGNLDFHSANSFYHNQSNQDVADSFDTLKVSTFLWDDLRPYEVADYDQDDFTDGYVRNTTWNDRTSIFTSYAKFQTAHGSYISMKNGVWENGTGFDSERLKLINMPVLKTHFRYGVTGCMKNYMGTPMGYIVNAIDPEIRHEHFSIALGGMATLMGEVIFPTLNIMDMTWVNPGPLESTYWSGPWSYYTTSSFTDIVGVSQDPIALDYYASKNVLIPTAQYLEYDNYSSLDPDYEPLSEPFRDQEMDDSFHNYLRRSMIELQRYGYQVTMNQSEISVHVTNLKSNTTSSLSTTASIPTSSMSSSTTIISTTPSTSSPGNPLITIVLPIVVVSFISLALIGYYIRQKRFQ